MHHSLVLYHRMNVYFNSEDDDAECMFNVVLYNTLFAIGNESTMFNSKKIQILYFLFIIAMHDPTIYLI